MKNTLIYSIVGSCSFQRKGRCQYYLVCNKTGNIGRILKGWLENTLKKISKLKNFLLASNVSHFPGADV